MNAGAALARRFRLPLVRRSRVRHRVEWVALADGTRLATSVLLPRDGPGPWPTVLARTLAPAHRVRHGTCLLGSTVASLGHAVVIQECRGRNASEGAFAPFVHEAADGADAVDWTVRQPFCDGRLALLGAGYSGFAAWAALSRSRTRVHALVAAFATRDPHALLRPGGALALDLALRWGVGVGEREHWHPRRLDLERGLAHLPLREADRVTRRRVEWFREWIEHPERDAYWEARIAPLPERPPPVLIVAGWRHAALGAQLADYALLRERALRGDAPTPELVIGPWPGGRWLRREERRANARAGAESLRAALDFLGRRLGGAPGAPAPVRVFVGGAGLWRDTPAWPPPEATPAQFHLHSGGRANGRTGDGWLAREAPEADEPADAYRFDPRDPVPADAASAETRDDVLCYTTPPLRESATIAGSVRAVLFVASSAALTDFTATLAALAADGSARVLCEGVLRSHGTPDLARRLELDLGGACARVAAGERLRLAVSSSAFPRWDRPSHTRVEPGRAGPAEVAPARQSVFHERERASHVSLPLLPG